MNLEPLHFICTNSLVNYPDEFKFLPIDYVIRFRLKKRIINH